MSDNKVSLPAFYGIKAGMTRIFDTNGNHVPVTVVKLIPNVISQVKTAEKDGYTAYQVAYNEKRASLVTSPVKGHLKKATIETTFSEFSEIKVDSVSADALGKKHLWISFHQQHTSTLLHLLKVKDSPGL